MSVCGSVAKQLHKDVVSSYVQQHLSKEDLLGDKGVIPIFAPKPLVRAVFYYTGRHSVFEECSDIHLSYHNM